MGGVERDEAGDIPGITIVCPGDIVSTRPSGPAGLRIAGYGDKLSEAIMAEKTILALLREAAAQLTSLASAVRMPAELLREVPLPCPASRNHLDV